MKETSGISDIRDQSCSPSVDRELVLQFLASLEESNLLSEADRERFIGTAVSGQLNPFKREIFLKITRENGVVGIRIITGYEVYLRKAEATGLLDGWRAWTEGGGEELRAIVEIRRKDWGNPFLHEVYWTEAVQKDVNGQVSSFWERMPRFQLKKVAISQGFRLCFAKEIGGMPYESAELPDGDKPAFIPTELRIGRTESSPNKIATGVVALVELIQKQAMEHKDLLSDTHLEWIENQLRQEKTEAQLRGLLKHVQEAIDSGDDRSNERKRGNTRPSYPRPAAKTTKPRLHVNYPRPPVPQDAAIF